jgi:hypothetical protein
MARGRRNHQATVLSDTAAAMSRMIPPVCPVCGSELPRTKDEATAHLRTHAPTEACTREVHVTSETRHLGWKVDWDAIRNPTPTSRYFYCDPCGFYA